MYSVLYIHRAVNSELCRGILGVAVEETAHLLLGGNACFVEWRQHKELLLAVCDGESETNATQTEIKKPRKTARLLSSYARLCSRCYGYGGGYYEEYDSQHCGKRCEHDGEDTQQTRGAVTFVLRKKALARATSNSAGAFVSALLEHNNNDYCNAQQGDQTSDYACSNGTSISHAQSGQ